MTKLLNDYYTTIKNDNISMNTLLLINLQAFASTQHFLDHYYRETLADDIGSICSSLMLLNDNKPADPALEKDWLDSAKIIIPHYQESMPITADQAFRITKEFLELYCRIGYSEQVNVLINRMKKNENEHIIDTDIRKLWDKSIKLAIKDGPMYLQLV